VAIAVVLAATLLGVPASAHARSVVVEDGAGDTIDPGLDITSAAFKNRERAVVVTVTFTRDRRGEVIVAIDRRKRPFVRLVSLHRRHGPDNTFMITQSSPDACHRVSSDWDRANGVLRLRMPAGCLGDGDYPNVDRSSQLRSSAGDWFRT
jgi:hypothetical protein